MSGSEGIESNDINLEEKDSSASLAAENARLKKKLKNANHFSLVLGILCLLAIGAIVGLLVYHSVKEDSNDDDDPKDCGKIPEGFVRPRIQLGEPDDPSPFHDVTAKEMNRVRTFLKDSGILTVKQEDALLNDTYIYTIDLEPPEKSKALDYTSRGSEAPDRYARVYLFRGDSSEPVVEERLCGPLKNITSCVLDRTSPYAYRPIESREYRAYEVKLFPDIHKEFGDILRESFGGSFDYENCEDNCFNWWASLLSSNVYGEGNVRKFWMTPVYDLPYYSIFPVDMSFLCNINGSDPTKFHVEQVWYAGEFFESPQDLKERYANDTINKLQMRYPTEAEAHFATLEQRGDPKPLESLRPPELIEPDGKRYSINHRKVNYLNMWSFHYRNSPIYGPALYEIHFLEERIVYELSLQEIATIYSGANPQSRLQYFISSVFLTGSKSKALVAGADCPKTATFLPITVAAQDSDQPAIFKRSICIFEQNTGAPLRRHHSYSSDEKTFYGGMLDSALVVRSIHTVDNVDFVVDFTFHQNGAIGVSIMSSGYLAGNAWASAERPYGHHIHDVLFGPMYQFVANFKVDLDIGGSSANRYETLNLLEETVTLRGTGPPKQYSQTKFEFRPKSNETEAAHIFDFDLPMQHIFHNNAEKNNYDERKAYKIVNHSPSKTMMKNGFGLEPSTSWARYQVAVTKRKEQEQRSSTFYSQHDGLDPAVNFQGFIDDDESLVDKDLVAWVTIGDHHIPSSEDLPIVSTAGKKISFYLMPYNFFSDCPSMASRDAIHITEKDSEDPSKGLKFDFHGTGDVSNQDGGACTYRPHDMTALWRNDPDELFEVNYNKGVY